MTVTLNAAVDKTLRVANLQIGLRHRCAQGLVQPGGKGINVARALKALGQPVLATGLAGGRNGTRIVEELTAAGILNDFVRIHEESRTSTLLVDPAIGDSHTGHGVVMPSCIHGGPGRAGGGEELGALRGLWFYHQKVAVQASAGTLGALGAMAWSTAG